MDIFDKASSLINTVGRIGANVIQSREGLKSSARSFDGTNVQELLDSKFDLEKLEGLRILVAMMVKGKEVSSYFPHVVKTIVSSNLEIRRLAYTFIQHHAPLEPDLTLLSINSIQKDLNDSNHFARALAVNVLCGIRVQSILPIVQLSLRKAATDVSPLVRKAVATGLVKVYRFDPSQHSSLLEILVSLLPEKSPFPVPAIITAFSIVAPNQLHLLHRHYRRLCALLVDIDEFGQVETMRLLMRYVRRYIPKPVGRSTNSRESRNGYNDGTASSDSHSDEESEDSTENESWRNEQVDKDLLLLLKYTEPLLNSQNPSVVLTVTSLQYHLAPPSYHTFPPALIKLLNNSIEIQYIVLENINTICEVYPHYFASYLYRFYIHTTDPIFIRSLKLSILLNLATRTNATRILKELTEYIVWWSCFGSSMRSRNDGAVTSSVDKSAGRKIETTGERGMGGDDEWLEMLIQGIDTIITYTIVTLTSLVQLRCPIPLSKPIDPTSKSHCRVPSESPFLYIKPLLRFLFLSPSAPQADGVNEPKKTRDGNTGDKRSLAKASIIWLVGEYSCYDEMVGVVAGDVFRRCVKDFVNEPTPVKLQILTLGAKLVSLNSLYPPQAQSLLPSPPGQTNPFSSSSATRIRKIFNHMIHLAHYDPDYDVRDRARFLEGLFMESTGGEEGIMKEDGVVKRWKRVVMFGTSETGRANELNEKRKNDTSTNFTLSTLSHSLHHSVKDYAPLEPWSEEISTTEATQSVNVRSDDEADENETQSPSSGNLLMNKSPQAAINPNTHSSWNTVKQKKEYQDLDSFYNDVDSDVSDLETDESDDESEDESGEEEENESESGSASESESEIQISSTSNLPSKSSSYISHEPEEPIISSSQSQPQSQLDTPTSDIDNDTNGDSDSHNDSGDSDTGLLGPESSATVGGTKDSNGVKGFGFFVDDGEEGSFGRNVWDE
ncbi:adaptin N terminal region-domain-containing protein [Paraphysoderma sedebokerense]|nr:adaptin N terminal region-domain-containing protein [Paraphysoderma sedebokerense]